MKIQSNEKGGKIIWDSEDWTHGLAPNWISTGGISVVRGGNRMSSSTGINPFRRWGCALPGFRPSSVTNDSVIDAYLRKGIVNSQSAYMVSNGAKIQKYDIINSAIINAGAFPHTITPTAGTTPIGNDCVTYSSFSASVLASYWFYSYSSTTIWDIGRFDFTSTFVDNFMSTTPAQQNVGTGATTATITLTGTGTKFLSTLQIGDTIIVSGETVRTIATISSDTVLTVTVAFTNTASGLSYTAFPASGAGYPHPLIIGDDDVQYMGDRNFLHAYDGQVGANGTFYSRVLTLPAGWIITSMEKTDNGLMLFTYYNNQTFGGANDFKGQARAWDWKYGELDITRSYDLNDNLTSESFSLGGGVLGIFTYGRQTDPANLGKNSKIQLFDGSKFTPLLGFTGTLPCRGGVEITAECISWNSSGTLYTYGSKLLGESMKDTGLNNIAIGASVSSGMLSTLWDSLNALVMSSGVTSTGGLQIFRTDYQEGTSINTALAEPYFPLYSKGRVKNVTVIFSNSISSILTTTDFTIDLYDENGTSQKILNQFTDVTSNAKMVKQIKDTTAGAPLMSFESISLHLLWGKLSSGVATESFGVKRIELDYEIINTNN